MRWEGPDGYWVSDDAGLVDIAKVHAWTSEQSYWASGRPLQVMASAIENSLVLGLYSADGGQAGFARFVTDSPSGGWSAPARCGDRPASRRTARAGGLRKICVLRVIFLALTKGAAGA